jgi:hypothetical protein
MLRNGIVDDIRSGRKVDGLRINEVLNYVLKSFAVLNIVARCPRVEATPSVGVITHRKPTNGRSQSAQLHKL